MNQKIIYLFTRTPLHVGAGASVGAIDQPIQRERHTGFPIIPASTLKGVFADEWNELVLKRVNTPNGPEEEIEIIQRSTDGRWLFGETEADSATAGALQFCEAKLLAFPVRSAQGSFAWITCPLILRRAVRDRALRAGNGAPFSLPATAFAQLEANSADDGALIKGDSLLAFRPPQGQQGDTRVVLEEYTFTKRGDLPSGLAEALDHLLPEDDVWEGIGSRLVIVSDGMMSFFTQNACEVAQHVRISDETGTAAGGALFNQENVPCETLFYSVVNCFDERSRPNSKKERRPAAKAAETFGKKVKDKGCVFQFGGDASTGLGFCSVTVHPNGASSSQAH